MEQKELRDILVKHLAWINGETNGQRADMQGADMRGADMIGADMRDANMRGADMQGADMRGANMQGANMRDADMRGANMQGADMRDANMRGADMLGADMRDADMQGADMQGAKNIPPLAIAQTRILPEGDIIGWKKCQDGIIVKLKIHATAKRSHAFGRKCRAKSAEVLELFGGDVGISQHDGETRYTVGATVVCDKWCDDFTQECAGGIHFFITREEAENY